MVGTMAMDTTSSQDQQQRSFSTASQQQKRCCGTARNPAPGELKADEVAIYLHSLSSHLNSSQLEAAGTVLSAEGWKVSSISTVAVAVATNHGCTMLVVLTSRLKWVAHCHRSCNPSARQVCRSTNCKLTQQQLFTCRAHH